jgi:hypothetical protein
MPLLVRADRDTASFRKHGHLYRAYPKLPPRHGSPWREPLAATLIMRILLRHHQTALQPISLLMKRGNKESFVLPHAKSRGASKRSLRGERAAPRSIPPAVRGLSRPLGACAPYPSTRLCSAGAELRRSRGACRPWTPASGRSAVPTPQANRSPVGCAPGVLPLWTPASVRCSSGASADRPVAYRQRSRRRLATAWHVAALGAHHQHKGE